MLDFLFNLCFTVAAAFTFKMDSRYVICNEKLIFTFVLITLRYYGFSLNSSYVISCPNFENETKVIKYEATVTLLKENDMSKMSSKKSDYFNSSFMITRTF